MTKFVISTMALIGLIPALIMRFFIHTGDSLTQTLSIFAAVNLLHLSGSLMVTGIFGHISLQVILNICVVINLIPTTGVTLPFVSYGGTSLLFLMAEMAIALSVSRKIRFKTDTKELWKGR